jgi:hypothetical protein
MRYSGILRQVALVRTDVSKERSASINRVTGIGELGTLASNRRTLQRNTIVPSSPILVTLMMEELRSSETFVLTRAMRRNITEDGILHSRRDGNLKTYRRLLTCCLLHVGFSPRLFSDPDKGGDVPLKRRVTFIALQDLISQKANQTVEPPYRQLAFLHIWPIWRQVKAERQLSPYITDEAIGLMHIHAPSEVLTTVVTKGHNALQSVDTWPNEASEEQVISM